MADSRKKIKRVELPADLCDELFQVAKDRGKTNKQIAPILREIIREWLDRDAKDGSAETIRKVYARLDSIEGLLRMVCVRSAPFEAQGDQNPSASVETTDDAEDLVMGYLRQVANLEGITPPVSQKMIAAGLNRDFVTGKVVGRCIKDLMKSGRISKYLRSGRGRGTCYRIIM